MLIIVFALIAVGGILHFVIPTQNKSNISNEVISQTTQNETTTQAQLTQTLWYYPTKLDITKPFSQNSFQTKNGDSFTLEYEENQITLITYWASWCKYCHTQLDNLKQLEQFLAQNNVRVILVNKFDEKETIEQAENYLTENNLNFENVYDTNLAFYNSLGIKIVPTSLFLNDEGEIMYCYAGVLEDENQMASIISYINNGKSADLESFLLTQMSNDNGGIYTTYTENGSHPSGTDVLSESQGLIMEYALQKGDDELFEKAYEYAKNNLMHSGLYMWYSSQGEQSYANALLDDLRILNALEKANASGKYTDDILSLSLAIEKYNTNNNLPVDFYTFDYGQKATRFTLCYGDIEAFEILERYATNLFGISKEAYYLVVDGYISDSFPFYKNYYDYSTGEYDESSLNMSEALYTVYNLSKIGKANSSTISWIKEQLQGDGIWARYTINGEVVDGYEYQSAAIYALVGLIAIEINDTQLLTNALSRMEQFRIFDESSIFNGALTAHPQQTASYDQCLGALLYSKME